MISPLPITVPSVADLSSTPVRLGVSGFIRRMHSESTNSCALAKPFSLSGLNPGFQSSLAIVLPFKFPLEIVYVDIAPLGVSILNFFFHFAIKRLPPLNEGCPRMYYNLQMSLAYFHIQSDPLLFACRSCNFPLRYNRLS